MNWRLRSIVASHEQGTGHERTPVPPPGLALLALLAFSVSFWAGIAIVLWRIS